LRLLADITDSNDVKSMDGILNITAFAFVGEHDLPLPFLEKRNVKLTNGD
jgi:hypothetical protein